MADPVIFLSAASIDLKTWRDHLHQAFSRAGFRVLTQEHSLRAAPGDVKRLLSETIEEADCVIHLAGLGYGSHANDPFPAAPGFQCSWTQFEYYQAHERKKDVIAFVCAPSLSTPGFVEKAADDADLALKQRLQEEHRERVQSGHFTGTPLEGVIGRTSNETADSAGKLLESVAAAIGTLQGIEREDREKAQRELREIASGLERVERKAEGIGRKVTLVLGLLALVALGLWLVKRDTGKTAAATQQSAQQVSDLAAQLSKVQEAISVIQQQTDPKKAPISQWPQERLEKALAEQLKMKVEDLRSLLAAGRTSLDALVAGQALLASGKSEAAGEKFDLVLQQEQAAAQRMKQAYEGKAQIAWDAVQYEQALAYLQKAAALTDKDADSLDWADMQLGVVFVLCKLARYEEAEPLLREIVHIREEKLDANDPQLATAINDLAQLFMATNRLSEAEPLMRRVLKMDEVSFGADHPWVARDLNNLARLLQDTNRPNDAEPLMRRAIKIDETNNNEASPGMAIHLNNLALIYTDTNRLSEAEPLMWRALKIDEASFGPDHPNVAIRLSNLAQLLQVTNRLSEAEPLMRRALKIDEASYGKDHPNVATRLNNLVGLLQATNRLSEAEPLMQRALKIDEASYGKDHPDIARDLNNLAHLFQATNRLSEAEPLMQRALKIDEASYGKDHHKVALRLSNLATLFANTNRLSKAEPLSRRAVGISLLFQHSTGHEHTNFRLFTENYLGILSDLGLKAPEQRAKLESLGVELGLSAAKVQTVFGDLLPAGK